MKKIGIIEFIFKIYSPLKNTLLILKTIPRLGFGMTVS